MEKKYYIYGLFTLALSVSTIWLEVQQQCPSERNLGQEIPHTSFYFIRHGQTYSNYFHFIQGSEEPLSPTGIEQAKAAAATLKNSGVSITTIAASPYKRAQMTAQIIADVLKKPIVTIDDLHERPAGILVGTFHPTWIVKWYENKVKITGAETLCQFATRISSAMQQALALPGPVLIVSHGGFYFVLNEILDVKYKEYLPNAQPLYYQAPTKTGEGWKIAEV